MIITRTSILTGDTWQWDLDVTQEQIDRFNLGKEPVQKIFPGLPPDQREFILNGITPLEAEQYGLDNEPNV